MPINVKDKICSIVTMPVSMEDYQTIKNFCEDHNIENVPERSEMCVELVSCYGVNPDLIKEMNKPITFDRFQLTQYKDNGYNTLVMVLQSDDFDDLWDAYNDDLEPNETWNDEPNPYIVLSTDYEEDPRKPMDVLARKLAVYLNGVVTFEELELRYLTIQQIFNELYNGVDPDGL